MSNLSLPPISPFTVSGSKNNNYRKYYKDTLSNAQSLITFDVELINSILSTNGFIQYILDIPIVDAFNNTDISTTENIDPNEMKLLKKKFHSHLPVVLDALKLMRYYGCSAIICFTEGVDPINPLTKGQVSKIKLQTTSRWAFVPTFNNSFAYLATSKEEGHKYFRMYDRFINSKSFTIQATGQEIHKSRIIWLNNKTSLTIDKLSYMSTLGGFGASSLEEFIKQAILYESTIEALNDKLRQSFFFVAQKDGDVVNQNTIQGMKQDWSGLSMGDLVEMPKDIDFKTFATSLGDNTAIIDSTLSALSLATKIPVSRIKMEDGANTSLNSTGEEHEGERHYKKTILSTRENYDYIFQKILQLSMLQTIDPQGSMESSSLFTVEYESGKERTLTQTLSDDLQIVNLINQAKQAGNISLAKHYAKKYNLPFEEEDDLTIDVNAKE